MTTNLNNSVTISNFVCIILLLVSLPTIWSVFHGNPIGCKRQLNTFMTWLWSFSTRSIVHYYRPHTKYGKGNVFTRVCHSVIPSSMHIPLATGSMHPRMDAPPPRRQTGNRRAVRILLEGILVALGVNFPFTVTSYCVTNELFKRSALSGIEVHSHWANAISTRFC